MLMTALIAALGITAAAGDLPIVERLLAPPGEDIVSREGPDGPLYRAGAVATDTKLPVGYARPTPPGAIELKYYPSIRQAEVSGRGPGASFRGFRPLFNHISSSGIAMTAPVEMEYAEDGTWTMAFLYHTTEDGPTGMDGNVEIIDTEPVTVIAMGVQGGRSMGSLNDAIAALEQWMVEDGRFQRAGDTRTLGYNGPSTPSRNRWWEVQIPVSQREAAAQDAAAEEDAEMNETL